MSKVKTLEECYRQVHEIHPLLPIEKETDLLVEKYTKKRVIKEDCGSYTSPSYSYAIKGKNVNTLGPTPLGFPGSLETRVIPVSLKIKKKAPKAKSTNRRSIQSQRNNLGKIQS